jgi:transcriptional regulator with PAS, ATPase and Fis domain
VPQGKLRVQIESERQQAVVNSRLKVALDSVSTNVMVADAEGKIIYLNPAIQTLLRLADADVRAQVPGFFCEAVSGSQIDSLHQDTSRQTRLSELHDTHRAEMSLGKRVFRFVANPIIGDQGRIGTVVEWGNASQANKPATAARDQAEQVGALDVELTAYLQTAAMRSANTPPSRIVRTDFELMYWTFAQMLAHHTSNGCNLQTGDLLASGTTSGPGPDAKACLAEINQRGTRPLELPGG